MHVEFDKSFSKSLDKLKNKVVQQRLEQIILEFEESTSIHSIKHIKKLVGFKTYYRIRIGEYRLGLELRSSDTVRFIIVAVRKNIYNRFP